MSKNSSVLFICSRLDLPGGTEKAVVDTANLLQSRGHLVTILIIDQTDTIFFPINPSISIRHINLHFGNTTEGNVLTRKLSFWRHVKQLRLTLKEINARTIIATEYHLSITAYLAGKKLDCSIYSWEHHHFNELDKSRFWNYLLHKTYPKLKAVICLNPDEAKLISEIGASTIVIPNFIEQHKTGSPTNVILTVARLSHVKGIDLLLQVAQPLLKKHPGWKWKIIGDGDMKESILNAIRNENMEGQLILQPPVSNDLTGEYGESSMYVMTSRNECFPMVLLEAMSYGIPCVAFDCETGPRHIINNDVDGVLVEDQNIQAMINELETLIAEKEKISRLGRNAYENVQRFSPDRIYELWKQVL